MIKKGGWGRKGSRSALFTFLFSFSLYSSDSLGIKIQLGLNFYLVHRLYYIKYRVQHTIMTTVIQVRYDWHLLSDSDSVHHQPR